MVTEVVQRVVVVGQGYVGLPLAVRAVEAGFEVVGFDRSKAKITDLLAGRSYIEDISDDQVAAAIDSGRYLPTAEESDMVGFDFAVISVPTPLLHGMPDISYVESAANTVASYLSPQATVVLESTTYPGTTEELVQPILEAGSGLKAGQDFHLGYSPERIDPGNQVWDFRSTPKVVSGIDSQSRDKVEGFFGKLVDTVVVAKGTREAELTKLLENTFRHVNIALVNELAIHAKAMGIDIWDVIAAAKTKPFGFMPFWPGPGVGGHCLPIDPSYLSWQVERQLGRAFRFVEIANDINRNMPAYVAQRVQNGLNDRAKSVKGSTILILGVAYKKNSSDSRETPATELIKKLLALGANLKVHDPLVGDFQVDEPVSRVGLNAAEVAEADIVVLLTDHDQIDYSLVLAEASYVLDTRNVLQGPNVETL